MKPSSAGEGFLRTITAAACCGRRNRRWVRPLPLWVPLRWRAPPKGLFSGRESK